MFDKKLTGFNDSKKWERIDRWNRFAVLAVAVFSWTLPRIGFLKFSELLALILAPRAFVSTRVKSALFRCYGPFFLATFFSFFIGLIVVSGNPLGSSLTSEKALYSSPTMIVIFTFVRIVTYILVLAGVTHFFMTASERRVSRTLLLTYYVTVLPGLLQMARLYSGIYFDLPFERAEVGPFSGIFDSGYMRLMGFEFEPLAYASSLITVCCASMHNGRRKPWLGLIVLGHTFGAGAIAGLLLAIFICSSKLITRAIVPLFTITIALLGWYVVENINPLIDQFALIGSIMERVGAIYNCISIWLDYPMGSGLGTYGYFMGRYDQTQIFITDRLDFHANNDPLEFLAAGGLFLMGGYLYTFYFALKQSRSHWMSIACIALMLQSASAYIFFNPTMIIVFSMLLARLSPVPIMKKRPQRWRFFAWLNPRKRLRNIKPLGTLDNVAAPLTFKPYSA
jgi:hypothetical protein